MSESDQSGAPMRDQETVELFIDESLEALQRIEQWLLEAESGRPPADLMGMMFRDIHTMKGTSGFLAFERTQKLAHVMEDLLAKFRDSGTAAAKHHYARLMSAMDLLRVMVESVKATQDEGTTDVEPMVALLRGDLAELVAREMSGAAAGETDEADEAAAEADAADATADVAPEAVATQAAPAPAAASTPSSVASPAASAAAESTASAASGDSADGTVRVNVGVLDRLMNLIGELVLARNQMVQMVKTVRDPNVNTQAACQRLSLVTSDLQEQIMKTRMQPVGRVFEKIPRLVRNLGQQVKKQVSVHIDGTSTEIDKALVEAIRDPVLHIVRNSMDHGFETPEQRVRNGKAAIGKLNIRASHEGGMVTIEIIDDGRGMDPAALRAHAIKKGILTESASQRLSDRESLDLIFRPGFSTAEKVTDISGRGVGMDVVRTHVERAGGQVELESVLGKGTTLRLKMPLTLAIIPALLVSTAGQRFAIPQVNLLELVHVNEEQVSTAIEHVRGAAFYRLRGEMLPLVHLSSILRLPGKPQEEGVNIVVVAVGSRRYGLVVDEIHDTEEIVIKPLHGQLKRLACYSGATVLGDGGVALILEVAGVAAMAGIDMSGRRAAETTLLDVVHHSGPQSYIVFHAGDGGQCAVPLSMVARLEQIPSASIERTVGAEVVQYRNSIMRILRPEAVLPLGNSTQRPDDQPLIVFDFGQMIGLAVNRIVDVVEIDSEQVQMTGENPFAQGRCVIMGTTTLLIDVYAIVRELAPHHVRERRKETRRPRVLLLDDSAAMRAALSTFLRAGGIDVLYAASGAALLQDLRNQQNGRWDALVMDVELHAGDGVATLEAVRRENQDLPIFVWTFCDNQATEERARELGVKGWTNKLEREKLVDAMEHAGLLARRRKNDVRSAA